MLLFLVFSFLCTIAFEIFSNRITGHCQVEKEFIIEFLSPCLLKAYWKFWQQPLVQLGASSFTADGM